MQDHEPPAAFQRHSRHPRQRLTIVSHNPSIVPDNAQVYDQHTYVADLYRYVIYGQTIWHKDFYSANPRKIKLPWSGF